LREAVASASSPRTCWFELGAAAGDEGLFDSRRQCPADAAAPLVLGHVDVVQPNPEALAACRGVAAEPFSTTGRREQLAGKASFEGGFTLDTGDGVVVGRGVRKAAPPKLENPKAVGSRQGPMSNSIERSLALTSSSAA
jgi:hypothetical protein